MNYFNLFFRQVLPGSTFLTQYALIDKNEGYTIMSFKWSAVNVNGQAVKELTSN